MLSTPARTRIRARVFDGLKKLLGGNGGNGGSDKQQNAQQRSEEEEEEGEYEGGTMMKLDTESGGLAEDQGVFGPLAVLLVGFQAEEVEAFRSFMIDMEADMVKLVPASAAMLRGTLQQAMETEFPQYSQPPLGTRRTVFLSGMYGAEVVEVIAAYKDAGLPPTVWAAAVPRNWGRVVGELVEEVHADNAAMVRRAQEAAAQKALEEQS